MSDDDPTATLDAADVLDKGTSYAPAQPSAVLDAADSLASQPAPPSEFSPDNLARQTALTGRAVVKGVAALPMMAMDAGVGTRNWLTGSDYELPSQMFEKALNAYLPQPETSGEKIAGTVESALTGSRIPAPEAAAQAPAGFTAPADLTSSQGQALQQGKNIGMQTTPAQESGSRSMQQLEAKLESQPWTSGPVNAIKANNAQVLNRSWAKAIGEDSDVVDSTTMSRANDRLGEVFNSVRDQTPRTIDPQQFSQKMGQINSDFDGLLPNGQNVSDHPLVQQLTNLAQNGSATGEQLGSLTSKLGKAATKQMTSPNGDRDLGMALFHVKDYADDLVQQGLSPEASAEYGAARQQYRSLMQLTARVGNVNPSTGNVSGASIGSYLQKADKKGFLYGGNQSDAYSATRFAQAFKPIVGDSGTPTRTLGLTDILKLPLGLPANLLSRAYYHGYLTPGLPGAKTAMGAVPLAEDQSQ